MPPSQQSHDAWVRGWVRDVKEVGFPIVAAIFFGWVFYVLGGKLVDAHIQHMTDVAASVKDVSTDVRSMKAAQADLARDMAVLAREIRKVKGE